MRTVVFRSTARRYAIFIRVSPPDPFSRVAREMARAAAMVSNYCDSAEHNEAVERGWVLDAGETLRSLGHDVFELYAHRLEIIEKRGVAGALPGAFDGRATAEAASTWLDLQVTQLAHDRQYHPDVAGLSNFDQLRHYAFHIAKLTGVYVSALDDDAARADLADRRLADTLLFGIKLSTVMGQRLDDSLLPRLA
jgi:hypothetical protein